MFQQNEVVNYEINPKLQIWAGPPGTENRILTLVNRDGKSFLVKVRYDPKTNQVFKPTVNPVKLPRIQPNSSGYITETFGPSFMDDSSFSRSIGARGMLYDTATTGTEPIYFNNRSDITSKRATRTDFGTIETHDPITDRVTQWIAPETSPEQIERLRRIYPDIRYYKS